MLWEFREGRITVGRGMLQSRARLEQNFEGWVAFVYVQEKNGVFQVGEALQQALCI